MTENKIHWSFWVICLIALIWNMMGSINFVMQMNPAMLSNYPEAAQSLVTSRPSWATLAFAIAVFGGAIGDILLLLKKVVAFFFFIASLLGVIITNIHTFQVTNATDILVGSSMSIVVAAFMLWYTKHVKRKGWVS